MAKRRLWILPLSPWQHELGVWAAGLILHSSELLLTLVKRMGVQIIVFSWKWGVKASLRIVGKPPGDMIRAMRDCEVFQISWFQLRFFKRVDFIGTCHLCFEKIHPALGWAAFHARNRICSTLLKLMKWKSRHAFQINYFSASSDLQLECLAIGYNRASVCQQWKKYSRDK